MEDEETEPAAGEGSESKPASGCQPFHSSRACFVLPLHSPARRLCGSIASSWWLAAASMLLTLAFCVLQCFWRPLEPANSGINAVIDWVSLGVTIAFTLEIVVKSLAWGFVLADGESFGGAWAACTAGVRRAAAGCLAAACAPAPEAADPRAGRRPGRALTRREEQQAREQQLAELLTTAATQPPTPATPLPEEHCSEEPAAPGLAVGLSGQASLDPPQPQQCRREPADQPSAAQAATQVEVGPAAAKGGRGSSGGSSSGPGTPPRDASLPAVAAAAPPRGGAARRILSRPWSRRGMPSPPFLRDGWNQLDLVVVAASWITFLPGVSGGATAARSLRLLLGLRSLTLFPGMKACTTAVLRSLPMLAHICAASLFLMWLFSIVGMQFYQDPLHRNCFTLGPNGQPEPFPPPGAADDSPGYSPAGNEGIMCSTASVWPGPSCPANEVCLEAGEPPQYGQLSFNNAARGIAYCFLIITTLWWGGATSYLMESTTGFSFFFSLLQVLIGWFMLSLVLAVLGDQYLEAMRDEKREQREVEEAAAAGSALPVSWARAKLDRCAAQVKACWQAQLPGALGRAGEWRWRKWLQAIVEHWAFEAAVIGSVLANTIVLGMPYYGMSDTYASRLNTADNVLTFCFVAEALLKVTAWGRAYFADPFNLYDLAVTVAALASFIVASVTPGGGAGGLSGLRAVRILRLLRLLTVLPALQRFLRVLARVLARCIAFFGIVALTVVLFAVLGMLVLGGRWDPATDPDAPRLTFNSFGESLVSVFDVLTGSLEGTMFYAMYVTHGWAVLYYMAVVVLGNFLVLNLLVAILYELFLEESGGTAVKKAAPGDWAALRRLRGCVAALLPRRAQVATTQDTPPAAAAAGGEKLCDLEQGGGAVRGGCNGAAPHAASRTSSGSYYCKPDKDLPASRLSSFQSDPVRRTTGPSSEDDAPPSAAAERPQGWWRVAAAAARLASCGPEWKGAVGPPLSTYTTRSFWLLSPESRLRRWLFSLVDDRRFEAAVMLVILFNCGVMALESPGNSERLAGLLWNMEWGCLAFYLAEMAAKLLALGAWAQPGCSYFRSAWNWLDFTIVCTSLLASVLSGTGWVAALRLLRVLRPLRLIARSTQMKAVVGCLFTSIISMTHVLAVALLVQLVFAILGMQLFMGEMHSCTADTCCVDAADQSSCLEVLMEEQCVGTDPSGSPCVWALQVYNFDNLWNSMVTLSVLMTGAYWSDVLLAGSDTAGQGMQMQENASTAEAAVYFTIYQCVAQFFVFNLFISVVLDAYNERVERQGMGVMLTEGQREWVKAQLHLLHDLPEKRSQAPSSRWRRRIHAVVMRPLFDYVTLVCILASGVALSLQHYGQSDAWSTALRWVNNAFTLLFCAESLARLAALFPARYFSDGWNWFDFVVTWGSLPSVFVAAGPTVGALRVLRAVRIARAVRYARGLKRIATTLYITLPTLANAVLVFALFLFMFAVLGTQLFYGTLPNEDLLLDGQGFTTFFNWQNTGNALMMLTNAATGDNWEKFQADTMVQPPDCDAAAGACGSTLASLFWLPFMVLCSFLLLSIVVAVVVEAYTMNRQPPEVTPENIEQLKQRWSELDTLGLGFINVAELHSLLERVDFPLGYADHPQGCFDPSDTAHLAASLLQVDDDGSVYYHEVLQALTARAAGISIASLGHAAQRELREETRVRKERQRQRQLALRRRQLQRQQRMARGRLRPGGGGPAAAAAAGLPPPSASSGSTLSRLMEGLGGRRGSLAGSLQHAPSAPPPLLHGLSAELSVGAASLPPLSSRAESIPTSPSAAVGT